MPILKVWFSLKIFTWDDLLLITHSAGIEPYVIIDWVMGKIAYVFYCCTAVVFDMLSLLYIADL